jgi:hypothetical protein
MVRSILAKNLAGWEAMEVFAGGVGESDKVFMVRHAAFVHFMQEMQYTYSRILSQLSVTFLFLKTLQV